MERTGRFALIALLVGMVFVGQGCAGTSPISPTFTPGSRVGSGGYLGPLAVQPTTIDLRVGESRTVTVQLNSGLHHLTWRWNAGATANVPPPYGPVDVLVENCQCSVMTGLAWDRSHWVQRVRLSGQQTLSFAVRGISVGNTAVSLSASDSDLCGGLECGNWTTGGVTVAVR